MAIISNLYQDRKPEKRRYRVRYRLPWMSKLFTIAEDLDHTMPVWYGTFATIIFLRLTILCLLLS